MGNVKDFFSLKFLGIGLLSLIGVVCIFTIGILGSSVNPSPNNLPVGLVIEDESTVGELIKQSLTDNKEIPFSWTVLLDKNNAIRQMNDKSYYATLVIPDKTSEKITSLLQPDSQQPEIEIIINEGLNYTASNITNQILDQIIIDLNAQIRNLIYEQLNEQDLSLPPEGIQKLINPLQVKKQIINDISSNSANGNAPTMFAQILWLSVFISSLIIFFNIKNNLKNQSNWIVLINQLIAGVLFLLIIVTTMLLFANYVLEVNIPNIGYTFLFLMFSGFIFFLLQNALINWIGLIASPFILLLFLFSIPVLNLPPEYLPDITKTLLYSWIPLKYSVEGLKEIFYFGNNNIKVYISILGYIGVGSFTILIITTLVKQRKKKITSLPA